MAIFANFQNGLIFRVLVVFLSPFLHRTTAMSYRKVIAHAKTVANGFVKRARFAVNDILILFMDCDSLYFETRLPYKEKFGFIKRVNKG